MRFFILLIFLSISKLAGEPALKGEHADPPPMGVTLPNDSQTEKASESMMLIWPELGADGKPESLVTTTSSGIVEGHEDESEGEDFEEVAVYRREKLDKILGDLAWKGLIPSFFLKDASENLWKKRFTFSLYETGSSTPREVLQRLSRLCGFDLRQTAGWFVLSPKKISRSSHRPISIRIENKPLSVVLSSILQSARLNAIISDDLGQQKVSIRLHNVDAQTALEALVKGQRLEHFLMGDIHVFRKKSHGHRLKKKAKKKRKKLNHLEKEIEKSVQNVSLDGKEEIEVEIRLEQDK